MRNYLRFNFEAKIADVANNPREMYDLSKYTYSDDSNTRYLCLKTYLSSGEANKWKAKNNLSKQIKKKRYKKMGKAPNNIVIHNVEKNWIQLLYSLFLRSPR